MKTLELGVVSMVGYWVEHLPASVSRPLFTKQRHVFFGCLVKILGAVTSMFPSLMDAYLIQGIKVKNLNEKVIKCLSL